MTSFRHGVVCTVFLCACFSPTGQRPPAETTTTEVSASTATSAEISSSGATSSDGSSETGSTQSTAADSTETTPAPTCGDGALSEGEECDDGGQDAGDGCSPECTKEFRRVFVTSEQFSGNMGGVTGAHALCQVAAEEAGLTGTFHAWLSDSTYSPDQDFVKSTVPYLLVDDTKVAASWEQLVSGTLSAGIYVTEWEGPPQATIEDCIPEGMIVVWTNTLATGKIAGDNYSCNHWAAGGDLGQTGQAGAFNSGWTEGCGVPCTTMAPLYCFEQ